MFFFIFFFSIILTKFLKFNYSLWFVFLFQTFFFAISNSALYNSLFLSLFHLKILERNLCLITFQFVAHMVTDIFIII